ncbi:VCBS repeat-containing protein [Maribacter flavus]|uniref:VCBS repeat-containing protein n=1 Tax=Maribacter flavus TaxID=1658664 RepID=A0A5B2TWD5_9FLAO|nr:VCBS repeat-containing protein [Maribacter flavus]
MRWISGFILCVLLFGCETKKPENTLFKKVTTEHSGLTFRNTITENETLNIIDYEYLFNGGGVGIGDFNSDGLPDVVFSGNMVISRIYQNIGKLQFKDVTSSSGIITDAWCTGVSIVDINNDGKPDIHISTAHDLFLGNTKNYFYLNETESKEEIKFRNLASEMNIADSSYTMQAVWLDYDRDGDLDLFLANNSKEEYPKNNAFGQRKDGRGKSTDKLYRNNGTNKNGVLQFEDVSREAGISIEGWSLGVAVMDINGDQYPDIYVANDFLSNDVLYVNNGNGTFTNKVSEYFKHQSHNSMGIDVADINNDGGLDFLVLDMFPEDNLRRKTMFSEIPFDRFNSSVKAGYQPQFVRNVLQVSTSSGFSDIGNFAGVSATDWSWAPLIADFDNDGLRDIYITNGYKKDITDMDFVDFNNSSNVFGSFEEKRKALVDQLKKMDGVKKSNFFFRNRGQNKFENETATSGIQVPSYSNGAVYADLDLDGDLDILTNNIDDEILLFENKSTDVKKDNSSYLRLKFNPNAENIGAKVWVYSKKGKQYGEFHPQRGYLSSVEPFMHFGLGNAAIIDSIRVIWPDDATTLLQNVDTNQTIAPIKGNSKIDVKISKKLEKAYLEEIAPPLDSVYVHQENTFDDFKKWPLLFRGYSRPGPILLGGDINGDGLEDFFVGGTANNPANFYVQSANGNFVKSPFQKSQDEIRSENSAGCFFDADNDGDLDLYLANGSSENYADTDLYQDVLYLNDGNGFFNMETDALPKISFPTNTVVPLDFDKDGDQDLFVAGRLDPNNFPFSPRSYLLENNQGVFMDVTKKIAPELVYPGMITDASAADINNDGWIDLILVGEWNPVQLFLNKQGRLALDLSDNGLKNTHGWWNCLRAGDFDGDGDMDFVAGNWGLNNPFYATGEEPLRLYAHDFDKNGSIEPIITYFNQGKEYILQARGTLMKQLPLIRKLTKNYHDYGEKTFGELFDKEKMDSNSIFKAYELASMYFENTGNGKFRKSPLPEQLQWSPIFDFIDIDINGDDAMELLSVGNFMNTEILTGHYDAGIGQTLEYNRTKGEFELIKSSKSGFDITGEARSLLRLKSHSDDELIILGLQNDTLRFFRKTIPLSKN